MKDVFNPVFGRRIFSTASCHSLSSVSAKAVVSLSLRRGLLGCSRTFVNTPVRKYLAACIRPTWWCDMGCGSSAPLQPMEPYAFHVASSRRPYSAPQPAVRPPREHRRHAPPMHRAHGQPSPAPRTAASPSAIPSAVVARHNRPTDGWVILRGHVYDITSFMRRHPGGPEVLHGLLGSDATMEFNSRHSYIDPRTALKVSYPLTTVC